MHSVGACVQGAFNSTSILAVQNKSTQTIKKGKKKLTLGWKISITLGIYEVKSGL